MGTRYAIVIGINDYSVKPLNYCVNDANAINDALIDRCMFKEENIHLIISDKQHPVKEVLGKFKEAVSTISKTFKSEEDSFFFFFAGHGFFEQEKSKICLHESEYPIEDIFNEISFKLNPSVQLYVIDACQSGGKVMTRSGQVTNILDQYEATANGAMMLFACGTNEWAGEYSALEHGLLSSYFIKAIYEDTLYDSDGILTPTVIQDYVTKATARDSVFSQIPVIENRIAGVYPLAKIDNQQLINAPEKESSEQRKKIPINEEHQDEPEELNSTHDSDNIGSKIKLDFDSRATAQEFVYKTVLKKVEDFTSKNLEELLSEYTKESFKDIQGYLFKEKYNLNDFHKKIYDIAENRNLMPLNDIFSKEEVKLKSDTSLLQQIASMSTPKSFQNYFYPGTFKPKEYNYVIDYNSDHFEYFIEIYKANKITKCSFGLGFFIYQAKWGIVIFFIYFKIDWDGEKDSVIENSRVLPCSYIIDEDLEPKVSDLDIDDFWDISEEISKWNSSREKEVRAFIDGTD
ncbi:caspase family protein [Domibacillus indicus]|uniref:caspase family protein n=1 Tax=Domibacillus indicus TaxID=1437523 RepID=UPI00203F3034|nr:caspase family protein [Domibacillus indicus]MCM3789121.1 caspase family protein [Domibacillus indicus]